MARILPLRTRVVLLFTLMGTLLSVLFAIAVVFIAEDYEQVLVDEVLNSLAHDYANQLVQAPQTELPRTGRLSAYLRRPDGGGEVPANLATLSPGLHESGPEGEGIHTGVYDTPAGRLTLSIDLVGIERLEQHLTLILIAVIALGTLISALLGWLLSHGVILPIRRLADAVTSLPVEPLQTELGHGMPRDELGRLGIAIDEYQGRLVAAEQAERAFFADASHELRTPIAVVQGATELLLEEDHALTIRPRLLRLDRGVRELADCLDALLRLARRRIDQTETVVLQRWLGEPLTAVDAIKDKTVELRIHGLEMEHCLAIREMELVVNAVVRRLVPPAQHGALDVTIARDVLIFHFNKAGVIQTEKPRLQARSSDRSLGLTLIGRLASQLGWTIDDSQAENGRVVIRFAPTR